MHNDCFYFVHHLETIYYVTIKNEGEIDFLGDWKGYVIIYLQLINSSINCVLYIAFNRNYRRFLTEKLR